MCHIVFVNLGILDYQAKPFGGLIGNVFVEAIYLSIYLTIGMSLIHKQRQCLKN